ncbi:MAG: glycerate kinase, partial [Planctomycetia bacterium]|nr:glycerate kinase [Planctomycetia bacterium]
MRILVSVDSFKGSLSSLCAGHAIRAGILRARGDWDVVVAPLADGGEGTTEALVDGLGGEYYEVSTFGPLGDAITARYGGVRDAKLAIISASSAAGLTLVTRRDPLHASTYGFGVMLREAIAHGFHRFILGLGGTATNDGGLGMLCALGYVARDANGEPLEPNAVALESLAELDDANVLPELSQCHFRVACDVDNPLCGERGASAVFGPQKGASVCDVERLDRALRRFAQVARKVRPSANPEARGAGAAGGLGFALQTFLNATLESGVQIVLEETKLEDKIAHADLVVTGEGRLDAQTLSGKAPYGVAQLARKYNKPVVALCGSVDDHIARELNASGIDAFFPSLRQLI